MGEWYALTHVLNISIPSYSTHDNSVPPFIMINQKPPDRLLSNPHAEPPTPKDWEVHPTYRVRNVPYYLAPLWDAGLERQSTKRHDAVVAEKNAARTVAKRPTAPGVVPKELREFQVTPQNAAWAARAQGTLDTGVGTSSIGSCSVVGAGGQTGCFAQQARATKKANAERKAAEAEGQ